MSHSPFSPSSSERWLHCPASVRESKKFVDDAGPAAQRGTLLHDVAAKVLLGELSQSRFYLDLRDEECAVVNFYVAYIRAFRNVSFVAIEQKVVLDQYVYGTADAIVIADDVLHVIDFKTGRQKVLAENHSQTIIYQAAALNQYGDIFKIKKSCRHIVQPSLDHYDYAECSVKFLEEYVAKIKQAVQQALDPNAPFVASESTCQWCPNRYFCRAWAEHALEVARTDFALEDPNSLTPAQLAKVLVHKPRLEKWLADAQTAALELVLKGGQVPHFTLGNTRSVRCFSDETEVMRRLVAGGYRKTEFTEIKQLPLTGIEKLVGKTKFAELFGDLITKKPGKPTLVPCQEPEPTLSSAVMLTADN